MHSERTVAEKRELIGARGRGREELLSILLDLQYASPQGYIDQETAILVAEELGMTETKVFEVISYYAMLKTKPQATYVLKVCNSSPCHFSKSDRVVEVLAEKLGVKIGQTTPDGMFAFHYIPCAGACDIGPIIKVRDRVFGNLDDEKISLLVDGLRAGTVEV